MSLICEIYAFCELKFHGRNTFYKILYLYAGFINSLVSSKHIMKKISVLLLVVGVILTIGLIIYFRTVVNPVDSNSMSIDRSGNEVSKWPIFIGIVFTFVGAVFYYVSHYEKKKNK
jgi:hypothetical protein